MRQQAATSQHVPCTNADVQPVGFFSRLSANDRRQLMALGERVPWAGNEVLFAQGARVTRCYAVVEGVVGLSRGIGDSRRQITSFALHGDVIEIAADLHHELSAVTIGSALVWEIAHDTFTQFVSHRPYVLNAIIASVASDLVDAHAQMFSLGRRPAEEKLTTFLAVWRDRLAGIGKAIDPLPLPMSRKDIADHLGLTVETVCRTLAKLERRGAIEILPGRVRLIAEPSVLAQAGS